MSTNHTPGPWVFYADTPSTDPNWHIVTTASRMCVLANVHIEPGNEMDLANARLIAAAPLLLDAARQAEALLSRQKWIASGMTPEGTVLLSLRAALDAATQESVS